VVKEPRPVHQNLSLTDLIVCISSPERSREHGRWTASHTYRLIFLIIADWWISIHTAVKIVRHRAGIRSTTEQVQKNLDLQVSPVEQIVDPGARRLLSLHPICCNYVHTGPRRPEECAMHALFRRGPEPPVSRKPQF
jgi:hypothetical protein